MSAAVAPEIADEMDERNFYSHVNAHVHDLFEPGAATKILRLNQNFKDRYQAHTYRTYREKTFVDFQTDVERAVLAEIAAAKTNDRQFSLAEIKELVRSIAPTLTLKRVLKRMDTPAFQEELSKTKNHALKAQAESCGSLWHLTPENLFHVTDLIEARHHYFETARDYLASMRTESSMAASYQTLRTQITQELRALATERTRIRAAMRAQLTSLGQHSNLNEFDAFTRSILALEANEATGSTAYRDLRELLGDDLESFPANESTRVLHDIPTRFLTPRRGLSEQQFQLFHEYAFEAHDPRLQQLPWISQKTYYYDHENERWISDPLVTLDTSENTQPSGLVIPTKQRWPNWLFKGANARFHVFKDGYQSLSFLTREQELKQRCLNNDNESATNRLEAELLEGDFHSDWMELYRHISPSEMDNLNQRYHEMGSFWQSKTRRLLGLWRDKLNTAHNSFLDYKTNLIINACRECVTDLNHNTLSAAQLKQRLLLLQTHLNYLSESHGFPALNHDATARRLRRALHAADRFIHALAPAKEHETLLRLSSGSTPPRELCDSTLSELQSLLAALEFEPTAAIQHELSHIMSHWAPDARTLKLTSALMAYTGQDEALLRVFKQWGTREQLTQYVMKRLRYLLEHHEYATIQHSSALQTDSIDGSALISVIQRELPQQADRTHGIDCMSALLTLAERYGSNTLKAQWANEAQGMLLEQFESMLASAAPVDTDTFVETARRFNQHFPMGKTMETAVANMLNREHHAIWSSHQHGIVSACVTHPTLRTQYQCDVLEWALGSDAHFESLLPVWFDSIHDCRNISFPMLIERFGDQAVERLESILGSALDRLESGALTHPLALTLIHQLLTVIYSEVTTLHKESLIHVLSTIIDAHPECGLSLPAALIPCGIVTELQDFLLGLLESSPYKISLTDEGLDSDAVRLQFSVEAATHDYPTAQHAALSYLESLIFLELPPERCKEAIIIKALSPLFLGQANRDAKVRTYMSTLLERFWVPKMNIEKLGLYTTLKAFNPEATTAWQTSPKGRQCAHQALTLLKTVLLESKHTQWRSVIEGTVSINGQTTPFTLALLHNAITLCADTGHLNVLQDYAREAINAYQGNESNTYPLFSLLSVPAVQARYLEKRFHTLTQERDFECLMDEAILDDILTFPGLHDALQTTLLELIHTVSQDHSDRLLDTHFTRTIEKFGYQDTQHQLRFEQFKHGIHQLLQSHTSNEITRWSDYLRRHHTATLQTPILKSHLIPFLKATLRDKSTLTVNQLECLGLLHEWLHQEPLVSDEDYEAVRFILNKRYQIKRYYRIAKTIVDALNSGEFDNATEMFNLEITHSDTFSELSPEQQQAFNRYFLNLFFELITRRGPLNTSEANFMKALEAKFVSRVPNNDRTLVLRSEMDAMTAHHDDYANPAHKTIKAIHALLNGKHKKDSVERLNRFLPYMKQISKSPGGAALNTFLEDSKAAIAALPQSQERLLLSKVATCCGISIKAPKAPRFSVFEKLDPPGSTSKANQTPTNTGRK